MFVFVLLFFTLTGMVLISYQEQKRSQGLPQADYRLDNFQYFLWKYQNGGEHSKTGATLILYDISITAAQ